MCRKREKHWTLASLVGEKETEAPEGQRPPLFSTRHFVVSHILFINFEVFLLFSHKKLSPKTSNTSTGILFVSLVSNEKHGGCGLCSKHFQTFSMTFEKEKSNVKDDFDRNETRGDVRWEWEF